VALKTIHPNSYWAATAGEEVAAAALVGEHDADVAVVGGGFTGLRAALLLAESGAQVTVVEAARMGWGASGRNGGQVNPLLPLNTPQDIARMYGRKFSERIVQATVECADELFNFIHRRQIDCQARQNGWLRVAHCRSAAEKMRRHSERWREAGAQIEFLSGGELSRALGSNFFALGALAARGGCIHPLRYARELARRAASAGAALYTESPALSMHKKNSAWVLQTPEGQVRAKQIILCTNGYADQLFPRLANSIIALTSVQAVTRPLAPATTRDILPGGRTFADTRRTIFYGRCEPDHRFLIGSLGKFGSDGAAADFRILRTEAEKIFPRLRGAKWEYQWGGRLAVTHDRVPHLHEPAPGLLAGLGYSGRGVAMANLMGRVLAERAMGKPPAEAVFPTTSLKNHPFSRLKFPGVPLAMGWMRLRDRRETRQQRHFSGRPARQINS